MYHAPRRPIERLTPLRLNDTMAMVHQGEMIVPAAATPWAQSLMSGAGKGGGHTHLHVSYAPGGNMSMNDVRAHAHEFARIVGREFDRNPSLRPTY